MVQELVRSSVNLAYQVSIPDELYALKYSNLRCKYTEEFIQAGRRGYIVTGKRDFPDIIVLTVFALMGVSIVYQEEAPSSRSLCQLTAHMIEDNAVEKSGIFHHYPVLPYGSGPVEVDKAGDIKTNNGLVAYIQKYLLGNFEVDAIRAVIGNFRSAKEVEQKKPEIVSTLQDKWKSVIDIIDPVKVEQQDEYTSQRISVRSLYSPIVKEAINMTQETCVETA